MKKTFTFLFTIIFFNAIVINAQNYKINFVASGASNVVNTVKVDNLTQNISLTINGTDTLVLGGSVGLFSNNLSNNKLQIIPNPILDKSDIEFYAENSGNARVFITDLSGREILNFFEYINRGTNKFQLSGIKKGIYFVNVLGDSYHYFSKLISQDVSNSKTLSIKYLGSNAFINNKNKSTNTSVYMPYNNGDRLLLRGISGNFANIVSDIPTSNKTITFIFTACTDINYNHYATVNFGNQIWMAENLRTTKYKNGASIPLITSNSIWSGLTSGARSFYNNDSATYLANFGSLYNWYAVNTGNLCPTGWHVPTDAEWTAMENYLGGSFIAGGKLKASTLWNSPNTGATNASGFTAFPGGFRDYDGTFYYLGDFGYWWTSSEVTTGYAWNHNLGYNFNYTSISGNMISLGLSIRCVKD